MLRAIIWMHYSWCLTCSISSLLMLFICSCHCVRKWWSVEAKNSWEWNALKNISVQGSCVWGTARWFRTVFPSSLNSTHMLRSPVLALCFPLKMTKEADSLTRWGNYAVKTVWVGLTLSKTDMSQYINGITHLERCGSLKQENNKCHIF